MLIEIRRPSSEGLYPSKQRVDSTLKKLACGILRQAFQDALRGRIPSDPASAEWQKDALRWFSSDETHPGSLFWVCSALELEPRMFREWWRNYQHSSDERKRLMGKRLLRNLRRRF